MSTNLFWHRETLSNGLTVLLYPRPSANTAQLSVAVKYGSNQEPKEAAGTAHFLEHMLAGGSEKRVQRSRSIEEHGGILDFYTDREHVSATMDVLPQKIAEASQILSELFFGDPFEDEKFEVERKIILNELAEVADDPTIKVEELLLENLFLQHPIRRPVGGYPKTIKRLTLSRLEQEYQANYCPQNMVLTLSGNASQKDADKILCWFTDKADKGYTEIPSKKPSSIETAKPKAYVVEEKAGITQTYLSIGARTQCSAHRDAPTLDLIGTLLGGGTSSRLFIELREKNAVTYDVSSAHCKGSDFGYFSINCAVSNKKVDLARRLILKELSSLETEDTSTEELDRAKQIWLGSALRGMDSPHDTCEIITYMELQFRSGLALHDYIAKIKAITREDIRTVTAQYLNEDSLCTAILNPIT